MSRPACMVALVLLLPAAGAALGHADRVGEDPAIRPPAKPLSRPAPPQPATQTTTAVPDARIRAQDQLSVTQQRYEAAALQRRRLLEHLPIELGGVRIEIAGISPDGRRTALLVHAGPPGRRFARTVYRQALRTYGDRGRAYELRWAR